MAPATTRRRRFRTARGNTSRLIISALKKLKRNIGFTPNTITKYMQSEHGRDGGLTGRIVTQALRSGVNSGLLRVESNKYRLNPGADSSYGELTDRGRRRKKGGRKSRSRGRKGRKGKSRSKSRKRGRSRRRRRKH